MFINLRLEQSVYFQNHLPILSCFAYTFLRIILCTKQTLHNEKKVYALYLLNNNYYYNHIAMSTFYEQHNTFLGSVFLGRTLFDRYLFLFLVGAELIMSFSFLGYIHISPISLTIAYFPIILSGILLKMPQTLILSFIFGFASLFKASPNYVMPSDAVFSPFSGSAPFSSLFLSLGTRLFFGFLIALFFAAVKNKKSQYIWIAVIAAIAPKLHSLIVLTSLGILFPKFNLDYHQSLTLSFNDFLTAAASVFLCVSLWRLLNTETIQSIKYAINHSPKNPYKSKWLFLSLLVFIFLLIGIAAVAALYFTNREIYMLRQYAVIINSAISTDLFFLQCQFVFAMIGLQFLAITAIFSFYHYMSYKEYQDGIDPLTNVMGRKMFFYCCDKVEAKTLSDKKHMPKWFLFVDVDYFKVINDSFGHATGDRILCGIASYLLKAFKEIGYVGRIGGDEFAVIIDKTMTEAELAEKLTKFLENISTLLPEQKISCSIGGYEFTFPEKHPHVLSMADDMLYKAKENGRACFKLQPLQPAASSAAEQ